MHESMFLMAKKCLFANSHNPIVKDGGAGGKARGRVGQQIKLNTVRIDNSMLWEEPFRGKFVASSKLQDKMLHECNLVAHYRVYGSVVEHHSSKCKGLRLDSSWGLVNTSLDKALVHGEFSGLGYFLFT